MKVSLLALLGLLVLVDASTLLRAEQSEKRMWRLTVEQGEPRLEYGTDNPEDTPIAFSCKAGRGLVDVWINETGKGVKPGRSMTASLTAGRTTAIMRARRRVESMDLLRMPCEVTPAGVPAPTYWNPSANAALATLASSGIRRREIGACGRPWH